MTLIIYKTNCSTFLDIHQHLQKVSHLFAFDFTSKVNIEQYAQKLHTLSQRQEAWNSNTLIGLVAYYISSDCSELFISNVSVLKEYQSNGIATQLLLLVKKHAISLSVPTIRLRVANSKPLIFFYQRNGYVISKVIDNEYEMILHVNM